MAHVSTPATAPKTRSVLVSVGALALLLAGGMAVAYKLGWFDYSHTLSHIQKLRESQNIALFIVLFVLAYGLLTSFGLPGLPFNVAAGALFGSVLGATVDRLAASASRPA